MMPLSCLQTVSLLTFPFKCKSALPIIKDPAGHRLSTGEKGNDTPANPVERLPGTPDQQSQSSLAIFHITGVGDFPTERSEPFLETARKHGLATFGTVSDVGNGVSIDDIQSAFHDFCSYLSSHPSTVPFVLISAHGASPQSLPDPDDESGKTLLHHLALGGTKEWYDTPISDIHMVLSTYQGPHELLVVLDSCHSVDSLERAKHFTALEQGERVALIHTSGINAKVIEQPWSKFSAALSMMDGNNLVNVLSHRTRLLHAYHKQAVKEEELLLCIRQGQTTLGCPADFP